MDTKVIIAAEELRKAGISILITNSKKVPVGGEWRQFEKKIPTRDELESRCAAPYATSVATIGGKVSGGLETIDFEGIKKVGKCCFEEWRGIVKGRFPELFAKLSINSTPNGGFHVRYHYEAEKYDTQMDLARIPNTKPEKKQKTAVLIETRGEGHYALCPPSPGYEMIQGDITRPPTISLKERNFLLSIARSFNEVGVGVDGEGSKPGDDFKQRGDHRALLEKHGWILALKRENGVEYWRRPGKEENWSATWNVYPGCFYVFSLNAEPFEAEKSYNLFAMFAFLECNGDFKAAAKALGEMGYGEKKTPKAKKVPCPSRPALRDSENRDVIPTQHLNPADCIQDFDKLNPAENFDILNYRCTDSGNAELFAELHGQNLRFDHVRNEWFRWNGIYWEIDRTKTVVQLAKKTARRRLQEGINIDDDDARAKQAKWAIASEAEGKINACLGIAKTESLIAIDGSEWDRDEMMLGVQNGSVDLRTGEFRQSRREDYISKSTKISFDEKATCPRWKRFLEEIFEGKIDIINYIHRAMGYSLSGNIEEHCFFLCYGSGRNGKGTLLNTVFSFLKDYAATTAFSTFESSKYQNTNSNDLAALRGVRFVSAQETKEARRLNEARIKTLTGGDPITCRYLYSEFFSYLPSFKVWLSVNHKPIIRDTSLGMWSKVRLIPFNVSFWKREEKQLPKTLEKEMSGILNWTIDGCLEWQKKGLAEPTEVLAETEQYQAESDPIALFLAEKTIMDNTIQTQAKDLFTAYTEWCKANGEWPMTNQMLGRRLTEKGFTKERRGSYIFYSGLGLAI